MKATKHWLLQRVSAGLSLIGTIFTILFIKQHLFQSVNVLKKSLSQPMIALMIICTFITFLYHARLGLHIIITDYLKGKSQKIFLTLVDATSFLAIFAILYSLIKLTVKTS